MLLRSSETMKLFQNVRKFFDEIGIFSGETNQAQLFPMKILVLSLSVLIVFISICAFAVMKATTMTEYALCFYGCITHITGLGVYVIIALEMPKMVKFMENSDEFVAKSETVLWIFQCFSFIFQINFVRILFKLGMENDLPSCVCIYREVNIKIEHFSQLAHVILMKMTFIVIIVPPVIVTYFKYYLLGLGDASFPENPYVYGTVSQFQFIE